MVDPGEDCDDSNLSPGDGCEPDCTELLPQPIWTDTIDGEGSADTANAIALLPSGDLVVVGHLEKAIGERDVWVARYDLAGNLLWSHSHDLGQGFDDEALDVVVGSAAAPLSIIGSVAVPLPGALNNVDILLAELDGQGNLLASHTYGGADPGADQGTALAIDCLGDRVLVGHVATSTQGDEIWLAKVDAMGGLLWEQLVGGQAADDDTAEDIAILPNGSFVAVGAIQDANTPHMWISRRSPDGAELWTQTVDGSWGPNIAHAVAMAPDGSLYVGGGLGNSEGGSIDLWVRHYDAMGGELWTTIYSSLSFGTERPRGLAVTSNDSVIVIGDLYQPGGTDILIQRVDAFDTYLLDLVMGGAQHDDRGNDVVVLPGGGFAAVGQIRDTDWGDAWVRRHGT